MRQLFYSGEGRREGEGEEEDGKGDGERLGREQGRRGSTWFEAIRDLGTERSKL